MSEPIPQAIPTSADPKTRRPVKRLRGANSAIAQQANEVENLMWDPNTPIEIPLLSKDTKPAVAPPPEFVANVQGSSAGAGSGEFHVYKASRRREYERLRAMDEEAEQEEGSKKWEQEREEQRKRDEERTNKNRAKRNKRKQNKNKEGTPGIESEDGGVAVNGAVGGIKKPLQIPERQAVEERDDTAALPDPGIIIHDDD